MARTIVIGDIHGGLKALEQLLGKIEIDGDDQLIFLGDYVDGWSGSALVVSYLIELDKIYPCIFIKGNHDAWCESWLRDKQVDTTWLHHGGLSTMESYKDLGKAEIENHLDFFYRLRNYYIDMDNRLFIHAGFTSILGPKEERIKENYYWDRTLWELALKMDARAGSHSRRLSLFKEIFIGHTPTTNYGVSTPMHAGNVWNIDTGAAFMGRLSAIDADTKQVWQTDKVQNLYPGEKGRNH